MPSAPPPLVADPFQIDEWVRHVAEIHFHPVYGAPYWIQRAKQLKLTPTVDIRTFDDLRLLGFFPISALRTQDVLNFLPAAVARDRSRLRVHETGGTSGPPARLAARDFFDPVNRFMDWYLDEVVGFPRGGNWLFVGPTGPHAVAESTLAVANMRGGMCYFIDLDPRFIRALYARQDLHGVSEYLKHIRTQVDAVLDTQSIDILGATPVLMQALGPHLAEAGRRFAGMIYGGTQLTRDLLDVLQHQLFPDAVHTAVYGNTLMGGAFLAPQRRDQRELSYYPIQPLVQLQVVDTGNPDRMLEQGETGQICLTVLSEERFLPRVLERDLAERCPALPQLGWEGVANVRPMSSPASAGIGVY